MLYLHKTDNSKIETQTLKNIAYFIMFALLNLNLVKKSVDTQKLTFQKKPFTLT